MALVVDELATNAMEHAQTDHAVSIELRHDAIHGAVHDQGAGTLTVWPPSVDLDRQGGWGLLVVQQLTSSWSVEYHEHGKTRVLHHPGVRRRSAPAPQLVDGLRGDVSDHGADVPAAGIGATLTGRAVSVREHAPHEVLDDIPIAVGLETVPAVEEHLEEHVRRRTEITVRRGDELVVEAVPPGAPDGGDDQVGLGGLGARPLVTARAVVQTRARMSAA